MCHSVRTYDTLHLLALVLLANSSVRTKLIFPRIAALPVEILNIVLFHTSYENIIIHQVFVILLLVHGYDRHWFLWVHVFFLCCKDFEGAIFIL